MIYKLNQLVTEAVFFDNAQPLDPQLEKYADTFKSPDDLFKESPLCSAITQFNHRIWLQWV